MQGYNLGYKDTRTQSTIVDTIVPKRSKNQVSQTIAETYKTHRRKYNFR